MSTVGICVAIALICKTLAAYCAQNEYDNLKKRYDDMHNTVQSWFTQGTVWIHTHDGRQIQIK